MGVSVLQAKIECPRSRCLRRHANYENLVTLFLQMRYQPSIFLKTKQSVSVNIYFRSFFLLQKQDQFSLRLRHI